MSVTYKEFAVNASEALLDPGACVVRFIEPTQCLSGQGILYTGTRTVDVSVQCAIDEIRETRKIKRKPSGRSDIDMLVDFLVIHHANIFCKMILEQED